MNETFKAPEKVYSNYKAEYDKRRKVLDAPYIVLLGKTILDGTAPIRITTVRSQAKRGIKNINQEAKEYAAENYSALVEQAIIDANEDGVIIDLGNKSKPESNVEVAEGK